MSKAILVMDMPENCGECIVCDYDCIDGIYCGENEKHISKDVDYAGRPDWCPLKELPKRKGITPLGRKCLCISQTNQMICNAYEQGWNACLCEILKGSE